MSFVVVSRTRYRWMAKCAHFVISRDFIDECERKFGGSRCCLNYTQFNHMRCCHIDTEYFQAPRNIWVCACKLRGGCGIKHMAVICEYRFASDVCAEIRRLKAGVCVQRLCICPLASAQARHPIILFAQGRI